MKTRLIIFLLWPLLANGQISTTQTNEEFAGQVMEQVVCFTDRNLYLSGEEIWFSAFVLINQKLEKMPLSQVMFSELFDNTEKIIARKKFLISENHCHGSFRIPDETLSGAYYLRFYTRYQRNQPPDVFATIPVTVINTGFPLPKVVDKTMADEKMNLSAGRITIYPDREKYDPRSLVNLEINIPKGFEGAFCVSVARKGSVKTNQAILNRSTERYRDSVFFVPDVRGISLHGFVRDSRNAAPLANIPVYLSAFGNNNLLHISETKPNGSFMFALSKMYGDADIFITIDPEAQTHAEMLINNDFSNAFGALPEHNFTVDSTHEDLLSDMLVSLETQKVFPITNTLWENKINPVINLPATYDVSVMLDDFIELKTLREVFYEIVPPVSVKTDKSTSYLSVANYQTQQVSRAGLVILDHAPVFNVDELLKISPVNIERIDVINRPYYLGDHLLSSIVSIKTKTGDFGGYRFPPQSIFLEYQTGTTAKVFLAPQYADEQTKKSPFPDFRTTLYWNPNVETGKTGSTFSFYTSDTRGEYDVVVNGISREGKVLFGRASFIVE